MSGGAFGHAYGRVIEFAEELSVRLDEHDRANICGDKPYDFSKHILSKLKAIEAETRKTAALMREAEWLYSGDISEESFVRRVSAIEAGE